MKPRLIYIGVLMIFVIFMVSSAVQAKLVSVSASTHVLALNDDGTVWAWGDNRYGQLGINNTGGTMSAPQKVLIDNVTAISTGLMQSLALKNDGTVWAWGYGDDGRLGYGGFESQPVPVQVKNLTDVIAIAARGQNCYALKKDGTVWAWGDNRDGTIGDGNISSESDDVNKNYATPVQVKGLTNLKALGEGERGTYAIKDDGSVYAWGQNTYDADQKVFGALGDRSGPGIRPTPFKVEGVYNVKKIAGGTDNTVYIKEDGTVWAWGNNNFGAIGDGTLSDSWPPDVRMPSIQLQLSDIIDVSTMNSHSIGLGKDGTVWVWGRFIDRKGSMDNAGLPPTSETGSPAPVQIKGLDHNVDVSAGFLSCIVLKDDGSVWGWGRNDEKELGSHKIVEPYPVLIFAGLSNITSTPSAVAPSSTVYAYPTQASPAATGRINVPVPTPGFGIDLIFFACSFLACSFLLSNLIGQGKAKK